MRELKRTLEANRDILFDLMRVYLGIGLFVKGIQFISDSDFLLSIMRQSNEIEFRFSPVETFLVHYIGFTHLGGGLLMSAGLMTRTSAFFQLPILIGAVFFLYGPDGVFSHNQEFQFTALVLFLLILILLHGGGRLSVDHYLKNR